MKNIKIKKLVLENFKGIKSKEIEFGYKTKISGANATGKTTIFDAFAWILFNKNSAGEEKFNIRPLTSNGNRIDNVEIKVVAVLEVDGKEVELSKIQKQNWVKKRGTGTTVLQGNVNFFEIDGYPKSESEYKAYISGLVEEDLFKMLTNPQYFVNMKWKDQRDILMKFVSDVSDAELARQLNMVDDADTHQFDDIIPELEKAPSTDDIAKKFNKALSEWKKKQTEIPVRIDELSKSLVDIDIAEQELTKADLERQIAEIEKKISDAGSVFGDLTAEEMRLQFDMSGIMQAMNQDISNKRAAYSREIRDLGETIVNFYQNDMGKLSERIEKNNAETASLEAKKPEINTKYKENQQRVFDETPYLFDESKWVFDENSTVCSMCGQTLPEDKIADLRSEFECKKANAKTSYERLMKSKREEFLKDKERVKNNLLSEASVIKNRIAELTEENENLRKQIAELQEKEKQSKERKAGLEKQLAELPEEANYMQNVEYVELKARHDEVLANIERVKLSTDDELLAQFEAEKADRKEELDKVKAEIDKASRNAEIEKRISELETEQREVGQKVADQEKMLYLLEKFIKAKMLKISESINSQFEMVDFILFKEQLNGGMSETCECMYKGVPYSSLNTAARIQCGLDIIRSLSKLYEVSCPVFIDNRESCTDIPEMDCQVISLYVVPERKELTVN